MLGFRQQDRMLLIPLQSTTEKALLLHSSPFRSPMAENSHERQEPTTATDSRSHRQPQTQIQVNLCTHFYINVSVILQSQIAD